MKIIIGHSGKTIIIPTEELRGKLYIYTYIFRLASNFNTKGVEKSLQSPLREEK